MTSVNLFFSLFDYLDGTTKHDRRKDLGLVGKTNGFFFLLGFIPRSFHLLSVAKSNYRLGDVFSTNIWLC